MVPSSKSNDKEELDEDEKDCSDESSDESSDDVDSVIERLYEERKLVICVRMDLNMSVGKTAAQVGHAVHKNVRESSERELALWEEFGGKKITLAVQSMEELAELKKLARKEGLVANSIRDAGHTEVEPGTTTVLAIGPAAGSEINVVTGKLKPIRDDRQKEVDKLRKQLKIAQEDVKRLTKDKKQLLTMNRQINVLT